MNFQKIPDKLKQIPHWVVWRLEYKGGRAKPTKPPYSARNGDPAKVNDPDTWSTFEEAVQAYQGGGYNGIGFVFTGTPYVGIDIDDCHDPETGEVTPEAQDILATGQTYTELSQSGRGFHLILEGKMPGTKRRTGDFEMYDCTSARYFTMTGDTCFDFGIRANQEAIDFVYHKYIDPPKSEPPKSTGEKVTSVSYLTDQEILEMARKAQNGSRFSSLWDGDTKNYPSSSCHW